MLATGGPETLAGEEAYGTWQQAYRDMLAAKSKLPKVEGRR